MTSVLSRQIPPARVPDPELQHNVLMPASTPRDGTPPRVRIGRWIFIILTGAAAGLVPLGLIDGDGWIPVAQAVLPVAGLAALLVSVLAFVTRARLIALAALVCSLALLWPVLPLSARPTSAPDAPVLRVVTLNVQYGRADADRLVQIIEERDADVLVILEATPGFWRRLRKHGLQRLLPHATGTVTNSATGTIVATREPVECLDDHACGKVAERRPTGPDPFDQVDVRLADGTVLRGAHPLPPGMRDTGQWRAGLDRLAYWIHHTRGDEHRLVVTGDLNSSPSHPAFRRLSNGMVRSPHAFPWQPTWPQETRLPPFVQIDHVLSRGFSVECEGTFTVPGSDHAGVHACLRPTQ